MARPAPLHDLLASTRAQMSMRVLAFAIGVALERRDIARGSPGGVRRVNARTGAALSLRQTVVLLGVRRAVQWLLGSALPWPGTPQRAHVEFTRELERVRAEHPDDPRARQEALMHFHQTRGPVQASCLPALARGAAVAVANRCPVPFLPERQTLADLLAGTKMVRDGPSRWVRLRKHRGAAGARRSRPTAHAPGRLLRRCVPRRRSRTPAR
jgi:hypothetical protein